MGGFYKGAVNSLNPSSLHWNVYVALSDPGSMKFFHIIEQFPGYWETTVCQNEILTVFHTQNICHHVWKTLRTILWGFFVLQFRGEGLKSKENYGIDFSHSFSPFNDLFSTIGDQHSTMHCNGVMTVFHTWVYIFWVWKTFRTKCWRIVVSQSRGDCSLMWENCMDPGSESAKYGIFFIKNIQNDAVVL